MTDPVSVLLLFNQGHDLTLSDGHLMKTRSHLKIIVNPYKLHFPLIDCHGSSSLWCK